MRCPAAIVSKVVARPDAAISFVERQFFRAKLAAEQPPFPREMPFDDRPHFFCVVQIARPPQVPEERIHRDKVHVVVRLGEVAIRVQRVFVARKIGRCFRHGNGFRNVIRILMNGVAREMFRRAFVPAQFVAGIRPAPAEQPHAPRDRAVHERLLRVVPDGVGGDVQRARRRVDERIWRPDDDALRDGTALLVFRGKKFGQVFGRENFHVIARHLQRQINRRRGW